MPKKKILIVDDEDDFVLLLRKRLEINDYDVVAASNGQEGLERINKDRPDLVLLDIMMPEKDGYTMLQELKSKEETSTLPVIILTAKPFMKDLFALEGVSDYIVKPFDADELLLRMKRVLSR